MFHKPIGLELSWPAVTQRADGSTDRPYFEVQHSADLRRWQPVGQRMRAASPSDQALAFLVLSNDSFGFYRLLSFAPSPIAKLGNGGEAVFGYGEAFGQQLQRLEQISPEQFAALFPNPANYLSGISWDPTTAPFWDAFHADIDVVN